ncbi:MAG: SUMF1/EgtB/PvdO family nonheme iron enzyme [Actinopolymorphaceae bacterium]
MASHAFHAVTEFPGWPTHRPAKTMVWVPGGTFQMGSADFYPEEGPVRTARVDGFWMDTAPVTVAAFRRFVRATGYVTLAERRPAASAERRRSPVVERWRSAAADGRLEPRIVQGGGSLVFRQPSRRVDLSDSGAWWSSVPGASWRHPEGPGSSVHGRERHPVTHVSYADAAAYADWAGRRLPTEAEWEYAARGGLAGAAYAWGEEFSPGGRVLANVWQGEFPWQMARWDPFPGTSPVGSFPGNGYGLYDMTGNVWEWTADPYAAVAAAFPAKASCLPNVVRPTLPRQRGPETQPGQSSAYQASADQASAEKARADKEGADPEGADSLRVLKGGSFLCASTYCLRYRPAARQGAPAVLTACHVGFRCALSA